MPINLNSQGVGTLSGSTMSINGYRDTADQGWIGPNGQVIGNQANLPVGWNSTPSTSSGVSSSMSTAGGSSVSTSPYTASAGTTTLPYGSTTTNQSGPNGPFATLGGPLTSNSLSGMSAGQTALNTAFDPQNALYNQEQNLSQQSQASAGAAAGLTNSPYEASLQANNMNNFETNWENTQLSREQTGMGIYTASMAPATTLYNGNYGQNQTGYNTQQTGGSGGSGQSTNQSYVPTGGQVPSGQASQPAGQPVSPNTGSPYQVNPGPTTYGPQQSNNPSNTLTPYDPTMFNPSPTQNTGQYPQTSNPTDTLTPYQPTYQAPQDPGNGYTGYSNTSGSTQNDSTAITSSDMGGGTPIDNSGSDSLGTGFQGDSSLMTATPQTISMGITDLFSSLGA